MKNAAIIAVLAGVVAASPAALPQLPDLNSVELAPVVINGPPIIASNQTNVYVPEAAASSAAAQATAVVTSPAGEKRGDILNWLTDLFGGHQSKTTTIGSYPTATSYGSYPIATTSASHPVITPPATTSVSKTPTTTSSSSTACATVPEEGTYCGFINPEDACAVQPDGYGPHPTPDTVEAFQNYAPFHQLAKSAVTPKSYVNTFKDLNASVTANSYLGLHTFSSYNIQGCSEWCDNTTLCTGFNVYIERDPSLNPTVNGPLGENCPDPSSITNFKCTLWGSGVSKEAATNFGDYRESFHTVIVGSNGYEKTNTTTPPTCPGFNPPKPCGGAAINKPSCAVGSHFFPGPYDPNVCGAFAKAQLQINIGATVKGGKYLPVNFFNAYMIKLNGKAMGTYCSLYSEIVDHVAATYEGGWSGSSHFEIETSWTYDLSVQDNGIKQY